MTTITFGQSGCRGHQNRGLTFDGLTGCYGRTTFPRSEATPKRTMHTNASSRRVSSLVDARAAADYYQRRGHGPSLVIPVCREMGRRSAPSLSVLFTRGENIVCIFQRVVIGFASLIALLPLVLGLALIPAEAAPIPSASATAVKPPGTPPNLTAVPAANLPYDGTDPSTTGCGSNDATNYYSKIVSDWTGNYGALILRYSYGCGTAWAKFICNASVGCSNFTLWVTRNNDGKSYDTQLTYPEDWMAQGSDTWTDQVDDPLGYSAYACFQSFLDAPKFCTDSY